MTKDKVVSISRDNFLEVLTLTHLRDKLKDREQIDQIYAILIELLRAEDAIIDKNNQAENGNKIQEEHLELPFLIPGTAIHIKMTGLLKEKIGEVIPLAAIIIGASTDNSIPLASGLLVEVVSRVSFLKKKYGQLCVLESLGHLDVKTIESICLNLYGNDCKYPKSGCQFMNMQNKVCHFTLENIKLTIEDLQDKGIVKQCNVVEPIEWKITI